MKKSLYSIFITFFKVGTLLLGGGYVILPILNSEIVRRKNWIDENSLCDYYALAQSVPGVIAVNTATFVGYRLRGQLGAIAAILGIVTPAFVAIILLASLFQEIMHFSFIKSIFYGIGIGVIMLLILATKEMWNRSIVDKFSCFIFFVSFILSACFKISPVYIILLAIILGIIYKNKHTEFLEDPDKLIGEDIR